MDKIYCAICKDREAVEVDHDHKTGKVRGILCGQCNKGIAMFDDSIQGMNKAIEYIQKWF